MTSDLAMVDAHVHFWDPARHYYPWLCDRPLIPFRYGDYSAICRRYLPADYLADARPHNVVKAVYLEAEWDPCDPIGEMDFIAELRRDTGFPTVAIAQARQMYAALVDRGDAELDTAAIIKLYESAKDVAEQG